MKKALIVSALLLSTGLSAKPIATINGYAISKGEANGFLKIATKGKVTYDRLRKKDKISLVQRLAVDKLVLKTAMKEIKKKEQESIIAGFWLRKKASKIKVSDTEVKAAYNENKSFFKDTKGKPLPFAKVKELIRNSIAQKKAVEKMMKRAKLVMNGKRIPSFAGEKNTKKSTAANGKHGIYTVKSGNTLSGIASKYKISIKQLRKMNNMESKAIIKIGQKLKVPVK